LYDENVRFLNREFLPLVDQDREEAVEAFGDGWETEFSLNFILAEGAPARISAITQSLHQFRPSYIHVLRPKSYRDEGFLRLDGVQYLPWDSASVNPAMTVRKGERFTGLPEVDARIELLVEQVINLRQDVEEALQTDSELGRFWLRKTKKPVVCVLLVQRESPDQPGKIETKFHRGINLEVSMPTGSLCAERNCIGSAVASDPSLKREHMKMLAVLSLPTIGSADAAGIDSRGLPHMPSSASARHSILSPKSDPGNVSSPAVPGGRDFRLFSDNTDFQEALEERDEGQENEENPVFCESVEEVSSKYRLRPGPTPLFQAAGRRSNRSLAPLKRAEVRSDLNPIAPCGACTEWLKKVAEKEPSFRVLTFETADCDRVYVKRVGV